LTAVTIAGLFLLALCFTPFFAAGPPAATAPALIVVGALMMRGTKDICWQRLDEGLPAFLTIAAMPFTYSIANGIALGIVSWSLVKLLTGQGRDVHWLMYVLAGLLGLYYGWVAG
jgi:AGZA family xanthine/uracil permease-like MFS transporter